MAPETRTPLGPKPETGSLKSTDTGIGATREGEAAVEVSVTVGAVWLMTQLTDAVPLPATPNGLAIFDASTEST